MESKDAGSGGGEWQPQAIFCVYAQPDDLYYRELQISLFPYQRQGYLSWLEIPPGAHIRQAIYSYIQKADLIILLLSPDFLADDRCSIAMKDALREKKKRQVPVVPV